MINDQLAYVLINPYTIFKSRTGGVIARLFTRTSLELAAARMFAPSRELVEQYAEIVVSPKDPQDRKIQDLIRQLNALGFDSDGERKAVDGAADSASGSEAKTLPRPD